MKTITDIEEVKSIAKIFLNFDIVVSDVVPFVVHHPFFDATMTVDKEGKFIDLTKEAELNIAKENVSELIDKCDNVFSIIAHICKPYRLTFFKYIHHCLNINDFSEALSDIWVDSENGNQDVNVTLAEVTKYFEKADKKKLMNEEEYKFFSELPKEITVYRGVGKERNPKGLSYTLDRDKAQWFADRFYKGQGYIIEKTANKKDVLAYFSRRGESEIVLNYNICKREK